ncbi:tetratricopeptide repeat protein [Cupriavidus campinensis]|uniref:tetratricopeptide repeat protein n=1 Tax=Cupriavidus campinensis TaxID=151783 RepID=UPI0021CC7DD1|nr:sel1 repeat family protein [Cupriavidus campinensis]
MSTATATATATAAASASAAFPSAFRRRRAHPLFAAALVAVTVAAAGVAGAAVWRHHAEARQAELAQWQRMASTAADADALSRLARAADAGETAARAALGETLLARPDALSRADGERWLRLAADSGSVRAHFVLGKAAMLGQLLGQLSVRQPDLPRAWTHLEAAARAGDAGAAYYLGLLCRGGYGRAPDAPAAVRWLTVAAEGGVAPAMFLLANAYREGRACRATTPAPWTGTKPPPSASIRRPSRPWPWPTSTANWAWRATTRRTGNTWPRRRTRCGTRR